MNQTIIFNLFLIYLWLFIITLTIITYIFFYSKLFLEILLCTYLVLVTQIRHTQQRTHETLLNDHDYGACSASLVTSGATSYIS